MVKSKRKERVVHARADVRNRQSQVLESPGHFGFHRGVEKLSLWFLEKDAHDFCQCRRRMLPDVLPFHGNTTLHPPASAVGRKTGQQQAKRRLSRITCAHDGQPLPMPDPKIESIDHPRRGTARSTGRVSETQPFCVDGVSHARPKT